jgi:hypothetical protein
MRFPYRISQGAAVIDREPPEFRNWRLQMLVRYREAMLAIVVGGNARRLPCCGACPTMTISVAIMRNPLGSRLPLHQTIFRPKLLRHTLQEDRDPHR